MKKYWTLVFLFASVNSAAQSDSLSRTKFVGGISAPELLHIGVSVDVTRSNQVGFSLGVGPTFGGLWTSLNIEHRLYLGKISTATLRKKYFFRQSFSYYPGGTDDKAVALTAGIDLRSKRRSSGWTIDLGVFMVLLDETDRRNSIYPAIRFQYYSYLKKNRSDVY